MLDSVVYDSVFGGKGWLSCRHSCAKIILCIVGMKEPNLAATHLGSLLAPFARYQ